MKTTTTLLMKASLFLVLSVLMFACKDSPTQTEEQLKEISSTDTISSPLNPQRQLNAAFLIIDSVYNSELIAPYDILQHTIFHTKPAINTFIVAPEMRSFVTFEGIEIKPHYDFTNCPKVDILIVPSAAHHLDTDLDNAVLIDFVKKKGMEAQFVMSLCDGAFVLAKAGLLDDVHCTTFPSDIGKLKEAFPHLTVEENISFVHDGKIITSAGGAKSYDPALYLVELLYGHKVAQGVAGGLVIDWNLANIKHWRNK